MKAPRDMKKIGGWWRTIKSQRESAFRRKLRSDSGSAIVEFVALAIPLFIPVFIYLNHFSSVSVNEEIARSMAREVLRVYVLSDGESAAQNLSSNAMNLLARQWKLTDSEIRSLQTHLDCTGDPCLSANSRIKLTITFTDEQTGRFISSSAQEHLSPWIS
jgi:Flp pilus assembly protein TadG